MRHLAPPLGILSAEHDKRALSKMLARPNDKPACVQVFEEVRNLCFGLAARAVQWKLLSRGEALEVWLVLIRKTFANLFSRSKFIAESLYARGVRDPAKHNLNVPKFFDSKPAANVVAAGALAVIVGMAVRHSLTIAAALAA
jgi:hypothetical protein